MGLAGKKQGIEVRGLVKAFNSQRILDDLTFKAQGSEFLALLGESGCGKTTLMKIIAGFEKPGTGSVEVNGSILTDDQSFVPPEKRKLGMVFQDYALFPHLTVAENIVFGLRGSKESKRERLGELLDLMNLRGQENKLPERISGGQQQRTAVARALAPKPSVILMDEPFSNLDHRLRVGLREEIRSVLSDQGVTVLLVTHDQEEAFTFCDRVLMMQGGKIVQDGTPQQVYNFPLNKWVASFVGDSNFFNCRTDLEVLSTMILMEQLPDSACIHEYDMVIRPEDIRLEICGGVAGKSNGVLQRIEFLGNVQYALVVLNNRKKIKVRLPKDAEISPGAAVQITGDRYHIFSESI